MAGYFDRSGSFEDPGTPWVTLGGYIAPSSTWQWLYPLWEEVLDKHNLNALHMKNDKDNAALLADLNNRCLGPAREKGLFVVAATIETSEYEKARKDNPRVPGHGRVCVGVVANVAIRRLPRRDRHSRKPLVDLCFDWHEEFHGPLENAWNDDVLSNSRQSWGTYLFKPREAGNQKERSPQDKCGLETADYVAWNVNRSLAKGREAGRARDDGVRDLSAERDSFRARMRIVSVGGYARIVSYENLMRWYPRDNSPSPR